MSDYGTTFTNADLNQINVGLLDSLLPYLWILLLPLVFIAVIFLIRFIFRQLNYLPASFHQIVLRVRVPKESSWERHEEMTTEKLHDEISLAETLFSSIGGMRASRGIKAFFFGRMDHLTFEIVVEKGIIYFYVGVPRYLQRYLEQQIHGQYPEAYIQEERDYNIFHPKSLIKSRYVVSKRKSFFPIRTYLKTETDPFNSIVNTLSKFDEQDGGAIQIVIRSAKGKWHRDAKRIIHRMHSGKSFQQAVRYGNKGPLGRFFVLLKDSAMAGSKNPAMQEQASAPFQGSQMEQSALQGIEEKNAKAGLDVNIRLIVSSPNESRVDQYLDNLANSFNIFNIYEYGNAFTVNKPKIQKSVIENFIYRRFNEKRSFVLNTEELASIFHFPLSNTETPNIDWLTAKKAPAPPSLPKEGLFFGWNEYRGIKTEVRMKANDRRRHVYIIGMTGTGKSTLMEEMVKQDIANGKGVCIVDPHGTLVENVIPCVPKERIEDVIYFDPSDTGRPIGLNMLEADTPEEMDFAVQEMISIFYKLVTDPSMIGPMFEHNMRNAMLTLMSDKENPGTITDIPRIFTDPEFQKYKLQFVTDPMVRSFWEKEMAKTSDFHKSEMLGYLISKVGRFVENEMMRNIIGQPKSGFDFKDVMNNGKILMINLSKGKVGEINSNLLGLIAVSKLQMAALSRANMPEKERKDFYLYIDEFQNYTTDSVATILAEARKYRLNLIMAHQYMGQLIKDNDTTIKDAVLGNAGTIISFRIGVDDAEILAKQFSPVFNEHDLINIEKYNAYFKMLVDNSVTRPFNVLIPPPIEGDSVTASRIKDYSRLKYGRDKSIVIQEVLERSRLGSGGARTTETMTMGSSK